MIESTNRIKQTFEEDPSTFHRKDIVSHATRELIIESLAEKPLSLKEIFIRVQKKKSISQQAVHKALKNMTNNRILQKIGRIYFLNPLWLSSEKNRIEKLEKRQNIIREDHSSSLMVFKTLFEMDKFLLEYVRKIAKSGLHKGIFSYWHHLWWPLFNMRDEYAVLKQVPHKESCYIVCKGNSFVEKWCLKSYENLGFNIAINKNMNLDYDFIVAGNTVIEMFWPDGLKSTVRNVYRKTKNMNNIDMELLERYVFGKEFNIPVRILNDSFLCSMLKSKVLGIFEC